MGVDDQLKEIYAEILLGEEINMKLVNEIQKQFLESKQSLKLVEIFILILNEISQSEEIDKIYLELSKKYKIFIPVKTHQEVIQQTILKKVRQQDSVPQTIKEQTPRFFLQGEDTIYNKKVELKKLKEKQTKEKRIFKSEIRQETETFLDQRKTQKQYKQQKTNQAIKKFKSQLEKERKEIERENTSVVKNHRIKKRKTRMAGNKTH